MPSNTAAWQLHAKASSVVVQSAPYTSPLAREITIKNYAVAFNPVDAFIQDYAVIPVTYPAVLGYDVAGEVVEVGPDVTRFAAGDRVLGFAMGTTRAAEGAFQEYTVMKTQMVSKIPDDMAFEKAAVMPMGIIVGAYGLFHEEYLGLQHPSVDATPTGKTVLIWGGAGSMGAITIQLAVAAGYEVVTTASERNFDMVRSLGAKEVFDYRKQSVVEDIVAALKGKDVVGAFDAAGKSSSGAYDTAADDSSFQMCASVLSMVPGGKFIASVQMLPETLPDGIDSKFILGSQIKDIPLSKVIFDDFMLPALTKGIMVPAPDALVVGHGLESIQAGLDKVKQGVSAQKVVVTL